jgi:polyhydroxyalkanoate synthesis regulator phasin
VQPSGLSGLDPEGKLTRIIAKMARNRIESGITDATQLVDDVYAAIAEHLPEVSKRDVRDAISGYSIGPKTTRSEAQKQLDALRAELKSLSKTEDIAAGTRSPQQEGPQREFHRDLARQRAITKEIAGLERRMSIGDFDKPQREPPRYTRETAALQRQLEQVRARYARMRYKATRSHGEKALDELAKAANVPKTLKSIGDVSAMFRQGGYYAITHPISGLAKPTQAMLHSITDTGWRNIEAMIKADPAFEKLKQAGVEFTGVDTADPNLSRREEGYLGGEYLDYVPVAKQVKDFSERTFVSFLDAQRLHVGKTILDGMTEAQRNNPTEVKAVARLINIATGRGELGKRGNQLAPALNIAMFSPRLLASRVQLLNNMINPVTIARMPAGARKAMIADNVKFLAATGALLGLAKAAGATVSTDPDDAEFLKIRVGNTVYDTLTGLQQPLRYIANMARAASPVNSRTLQSGPDMYSGRNMAEMSKQFARSKLNPALAPAVNFISGQDFEGRKFSAVREARDLAIPLPAKDVYEGLKDGGVIGGLQATPTFVGIGVGSYPPAADKPRTRAEKLARKLLREGMPPSEAREEEQIETDREKAQLRARSRAGENVNAELVKLIREGKITDRQAKRVAQAKGRTRLSEDLKTLDPDESMRVYSVMNADERRVSAASIKQKIANSKADAQKKAGFKQRARELGLVQ